MSLFHRAIGALAMLGLWAQPAIAQLEEESAQDFFSIEVIIFRSASSDDPAYRWPGEPDIDQTNDLFRTEPADQTTLAYFGTVAPRQAVYGDAAANLDVLQDSSQPGPALVEIETPSPIQALPANEMQLDDAWRRLQRNRAYQPLLHLAWRQPASPFGDTVPIRIHGGAIVEEAPEVLPFFPFANETDANRGAKAVEELDGSIAFERGRFLHLNINLALHVPLTEQAGSQQPTTPLLDQTLRTAFDPPYRTYRLLEKRQVRLGTLNYFDHRKFGVITLVEKWQGPAQEPIPPVVDDLEPAR